jgi:hypothetical protein
MESWTPRPSKVRSGRSTTSSLRGASAARSPWRSFSNLEISSADAETMLAMKCLAARAEEDASDIRRLAQHLGLTSAGQILDVVGKFYDPTRISIRSQLLLEEMFPS